jgi:phosphoesterase RecJ-like protein
MFDYRSNITIPQLATRILAAHKIAVVTHIKPDGDAMGSGLALVRALTAKEKGAEFFVMGPIEPQLKIIAGATQFHHVDKHSPSDDYDLIIITDTGAWTQLESLVPWLKKHHERTAGIDHHTRGDDVAAVRYIDSKAVSTTAMLVPLLDEMHCELTGGIGGVAEALFVGLATDSGWFRYENAGPEAFALAARLLACGVNKSRLYQIIEETFGPQRLALETRALASLEYARGGAVAIQTLRSEDFKITGATLEDVTGLVNTPMTVGTVRVSILLTQTQPGLTKISFRSKPAMEAGTGHDAHGSRAQYLMPGAAAFIDVNQLAARFGGGGHIHAAGARVSMDIDQAKRAVIEAVNQI